MYAQSYNCLENITNKTLEKFTESGVVKVNVFLGKVNEKLPIKIKNEGKIEKFVEESLLHDLEALWLNLQKTANLI